MHPAYELPLPHPTAIKNPQEKRHTINIKTSWTECTEATPHDETITQTAKRRRTETNRIEKSTHHKKTPGEGDGSNSLLRGKPTKHPVTILQENERTATTYNTSTGA